MRAGLLIAAALLLSGCAEGYGYAYDYDPYRGPVGHYVSPFGTKRPKAACARVYYTGPYQDGMRGAFYAGPFCADGVAVAEAAPP